MGDMVGAERISEALGKLDGRYRYGLHTYWRARIAALLNEKGKAVELLSEAFSQGYKFSISVHHDPDFQRLLDYPPYQKLIAPKG